MEAPTVMYESVEIEPITYKRGTVYEKLTGIHAGLYNAQCVLYGKARATDEFWWLWHKKEGSENQNAMR